ncbi:MAG TPA: segregation/condensation protein A [Tissierellaceae bacterium]|nr:segregation/condensation protein A [Tissierellaceae bacterium]
MEYKIKIDAFQGPMDLLLHLIDKAEIDIYDIPINIIAEQFIEYIHGMEELNLDVASEFLLMAATLLEIKSKMLLPQKTNASEEDMEAEEEDPRAELIRRIVEYKKYKNAAEDLKGFEAIYSKMFFKPKEELIEDIEEEIELKGLNIDMLLKSLSSIIKENKEKINNLDINFIQREEYTLEDCIKDIKRKLKTNGKVKFSELLDENSGKSEIVVYFLSILELVKMKYINLEQDEDFSDLFIIKL